VAISESERLDMHLKLKDVLGEQVANTMINHLPPSGWTDVARKSDMDQRFDFVDQRFEAIDRRFEAIDRRFEVIDRRFEAIDRRFDLIDQRFELLERRLAERFEAIDQRFEMIDQRFRGITAALWAMAGLYTTTTIGLYTLIATKL
jgi:hypothetical protein